MAARTKEKVLASLEADAFPALGARPIANVSARDVAAVVRAVEARGAGEMSSRLLQRIQAVFRFAALARDYAQMRAMFIASPPKSRS